MRRLRTEPVSAGPKRVSDINQEMTAGPGYVHFANHSEIIQKLECETDDGPGSSRFD